MKSFSYRILLPAAAPLLVLVIWQYAALKLENEVVLPTVPQVWRLFMHPNEDILRLGSMMQNLGMSTMRVLCGYFAGLALALPLGILMGHYKASTASWARWLKCCAPCLRSPGYR